jgi:hypothetical protein
MILEMVVPQFSLTFSKSTEVGRVDESKRHLWKFLVDDFPVGTDSVFIDFF